MPALLIMVPMTVPMVQSVTLAILDAMLKRMVRSLVLIGMAVLNLVTSVLLVHRLGYIGAAIGTAFSLVVGDCLVMNWYYHRHIGLDVPRMFKEIGRGIVPCAIIAAVTSIPVALVVPDSTIGLLTKVLFFLAVYGWLLYRFGLKGDEIDNVYGWTRSVLQRATR